MVSELVKIAKKHYEEKDGALKFTDDSNVNALINDLENNPHAFVLGCVMDKQIAAPRAWSIPYKISKEFGTFDIDFLASVPKDKYKKIFNEGKYHRFNDQCAGFFYDAIHKIKKDYDGDASKIWSDNPTSNEVVKRFREFKGVGPSISTMAANILAREFKIPMSDYSSIDVSPDIHITRVMGRVFFGGEVSQEEILNKAREINPEFPGIIDLACRFIGIDYCRPNDPKCYQCPLLKECKYNSGTPVDTISETKDDNGIKIITWNCNGKFREKYEAILEEDADIYVIQECENPAETESEEYKKFAGDNYFWTGDLHYKGLGIFAKENISLEKIEGIIGDFKNFIALRVNDSFNLLGVWAMSPYVEMIHDYFDVNYKVFDENLIICGDFNSNAIWNDEHKTKDNYDNDKNQTNLNVKLNNKGLFSVYHELNNEEQGEETNATFFQTRHLNQPYHIDYVYAKKDLISEFEILDQWKWISLSDHLPLSFKLD